MEQKSGWATFFRVLCWINLILAGVFVAFIALGSSSPKNSDSFLGTQTQVFIVVAGIVGAIQAAFLAFFVNVLTDMRWLLSKLVEKSGVELEESLEERLRRVREGKAKGSLDFGGVRVAGLREEDQGDLKRQ